MKSLGTFAATESTEVSVISDFVLGKKDSLTVSSFHKTQAILEVTADLAETEKEKFVSMAENVEYDSAEKFKEKLETIKESYFPKTKIEETTSKDEVDSVAANEPAVEASSDAMAAYTAAISKNLKAL